MKLTPVSLPGLYRIESEPHGDSRGRFARLFCARTLKEAGLETAIVQINHSVTKAVGSVRGMHFQYPPNAEVKIVRCLRGRCLDVAVDLRFGSPTFLKWHGEILSGEDEKALYIPKGVAHGFQVLQPDTELLYFHSDYYTPAMEGGVRFDDPALAIDWPLPPADISERDRSHPLIDEEFQGIKL